MIRRLEPSDVAEAGAMLGRRHAAHRAAEPLVGAESMEAAVMSELAADGAAGLIAGDGFLIGRVETGPAFGRGAWIRHAGHAADDPETLCDLYACLADGWVTVGADRHYVLVPAVAALLEPWYRLGFGQMHVEAARPADPLDARPVPGVTIRCGGLDDLEAALATDILIYDVQAAAPSFSRFRPDPAGHRADWRETLADPAVALFVAERDGTVVGHAATWPADPAFGVQPASHYLASTVVTPAERRRGTGSMLLAAVLDRAIAAGAPALVTNWRVTNLTASRSWRALGFRPTFVRLARQAGCF